MNRVLSDRERGGFYASQDADINRSTTTATTSPGRVEEVRAVLLARTGARHRALLRRRPERRDAPQSREKCAVGRARRRGHRQRLGIAARRSAAQLAERPRTTAGRAREASHAVCRYHALHQLERHVHLRLSRQPPAPWTTTAGRDCRSFALRTLDRFLSEGWDDRSGFAHRLGGARSAPARWTIRRSWPRRCSTALKPRWTGAISRRPSAPLALFIEKYGDREGGGFFDRASDAAAHGRARRAPQAAAGFAHPGRQSGGGDGAGSPVRLHRRRLFTASDARPPWKPLPASCPQYGLFAATYGLATVLYARHPLQVLVTGAPGDETALRLDRAARSFYRFGKAVLRVTPEAAADRRAAAGAARDGAAPASRCGAGIRLRRPDVLSAR